MLFNAYAAGEDETAAGAAGEIESPAVCQYAARNEADHGRGVDVNEKQAEFHLCKGGRQEGVLLVDCHCRAEFQPATFMVIIHLLRQIFNR